jgi:hypothetical protein
MYVPPTVKNLNKSFNSVSKGSQKSESFSRFYKQEVPITPVLIPVSLKNIDEKVEKVEKVVLKLEPIFLKKEKVEDNFSKNTELWNDIYQFTVDPSEQVHLLWNHSISNDSMVKLLQEQGTIKFNPIQYYRNTIESHESNTKQIIDKLKLKIIRKFISYLNDYTIHSISQSNIDKMIEYAREIIEDSQLSESEKLTMIESYKSDLNEFLKSKSPELAFSMGFKHKQQLKFLEDTIEQLDDEKQMNSYVKQIVTDKIKKLIIESAMQDKQVPMKELIGMDKIIKKEFKIMNSVSCDNKYFTNLFGYNIIHRVLEKESEEAEKKGKKQNIKVLSDKTDAYFDKMEKLETIIRAKIYPYLDITTTEKITNYEKELDLFEYSSMKDKIIGEKQDLDLERYKKNDLSLLEQIESSNYDQPVILELANFLHSIHIESNKIPFMIRMLEFFTKNMSNSCGKEIIDAYIETYTYIVDYITVHTTEYSKIPVDKKKVYIDMCERATKLFKTLDINLYQYQLTHLYEYLSPLSHFDEKRPKLDSWQKDVFELMDRRKNVIVIAPTSSGKTALSTYCSLIVNKVLFVVPSAELARQVCGMIRNLVIDNKLKKYISLITEKDTYHDNVDNFDIIVGTPGALEMYFVEKNIETDIFNYIVFDEIHQLNQEIVGAELERWIKLLTFNSKSKFLALSACVGNAEQLHNWWRQFVDDIELVVCNRRFLQQQKFLWSDSKKQLDKIHPLTVCSLDFLQNNGFIDGDVIKSDMSFTPNDLYDLYENIHSHPSFDQTLHPITFFQSIRITLDNCKEWEWNIKKMLQTLSNVDPGFVQGVLDKYNQGLEQVMIESTVEDLYKLLKELQHRNLLPCILFRLNPGICQQKFTELVNYLKEEESKVFPYYYEDLKYAQEFYTNMLEQEKELDDIEIPDDSGNPQIYIEERKKKLKSANLGIYQKRFTDHMKSRISYNVNKIEDLKQIDKFSESEKEYMLTNLTKQIKYYEKQISRTRRQQELTSVNIYKPHPDFTFLEEHVHTEHIIEYRRQLMDFMKEEKKSQIKIERLNHIHEEDISKDKSDIRKETYVSYDHPFMIGMERGVILYLNRLPTPFQRVAQSLIASFMKLAPVTFSDQSLAFGVNYPIRSVILTGGYINPIVAHQMIGRAGRRGVDPKGYTIYYGVDWQTIIKEKYLEVKGTDMIDGAIWAMPYLWTNLNDKFELVSKYHLKDYTEDTTILENQYNSFMDDITQIYELFNDKYNIELLEDGTYEFMIRDVYKNKHLGIQSIFIPYMLEEISRWKFIGSQLDSYTKWDIIQLLTSFLNSDFKNELFSEGFRNKIEHWYSGIGNILDKYTKKTQFKAYRLEDKFTENTIPYWFAISSLISTLYSLCKDRRINTLLSGLFMEIKNRLKKYTF